MSKTIALHGSKDLLIQARKDLVNAGFKDDKWWNENEAPTLANYHISHLHIGDKNGIFFLNGAYRVKRISLTPENYAETIQSIILKKDELCN